MTHVELLVRFAREPFVDADEFPMARVLGVETPCSRLNNELSSSQTCVRDVLA